MCAFLDNSSYNKYQEELYTVSVTGRLDTEEFQTHVKLQNSVPRLNPVLNEITVEYPNARQLQFVLSHFMYQYDDPAKASESYLVINQYANLALSTIDQHSNTGDLPSASYYLSDGHVITDSALMPEERQLHDELLDRFLRQRSQLQDADGLYVDTVDTKKYLVTYTSTASTDASLVMLQEYDAVFHDLEQLRNDFLAILALLMSIALILVFCVSRRLYTPINRMLTFFTGNSELSEEPQKRLNELEYIKNIYERANQQYQRLASKESLHTPMAIQYHLYSILLKSDEPSVRQYCRMMPEHWLSSYGDGPLRILMIQAFHIKPEYQVDDIDALTLYAIQNISEELLGESYRCACFRHGEHTLGIVLGALNPSSTLPLPLKETLDRIYEFILRYFSVKVVLAATEEGQGLFSLNTLFNEANRCLSYGPLFESGLITAERCALNECNTQTSYGPELEAALEDAFRTQNLAKIRVVLSEIHTVIATFSSSNAMICVVTLVNTLDRLLSQYKPDGCQLRSGTAFNSLYRHVLDGYAISSCFEELQQCVEDLFSSGMPSSMNSDELFIATIMEFVQKSYSDPNLSSQLIADNISLSNRYVMKKFRLLTGITLADHILDIRMKKAANLLQNTDTPISAIAEKIGIGNLSYFYKLFKKAYGCTPREFADMAHGERIR